ncbi:hypothetical protein ASPCAL13996 [Aspergillus calidoustus]|uniref:FAD-binding domain-containing protein n=1 Tax=Aspergillus calidoustus TaxID=454130 RepID=A0A0U5CJ09_ASPCI|nr:hypothetical protein ASPCAL13996 [Aspergillus calidoustus]
MTKTDALPQDRVPCAPPTVLVIGLGIAGLTAAIECHRKGCKVIGFEKKRGATQPGDIIGLSGNSVRVLSQWSPEFSQFADEEITCAVEALEFYDPAGNLHVSMPYNPASPTQGYMFRRTGLLEKLYEQAIRDGIELRYGVNVTGYWEDVGSAGVYIGDSNHNIVADCVIAADGFHSTARKVFTSEKDALQRDEFIGAIAYRAIFDARETTHLPEAQWLLDKAPAADVFRSFFGNDFMFVTGTAARGRYIHWACALRGEQAEQTSQAWVQPASAEPVLDRARTWPSPTGSKLAAVISATPPDACFSHALLAKPPLRTWVSPKGRMVVIGDAAHPILPYAGQGANQAIEDAAVIAICLERAGPKRIPLALRVFEKLREHQRSNHIMPNLHARHERVSLIQAGSIEAEDAYLKANWEGGDETKKPSGYLQQPWVYEHDCVAHAQAEFDIAVEAIETGRKYIPTNVPMDGKYRSEQ